MEKTNGPAYDAFDDDSELEQVRTPAAERKSRKCLMCEREFESEGVHNRICRRCKASQAYRGA